MRLFPALILASLLVLTIWPTPGKSVELTRSLELQGLGGETLMESDLSTGSAIVVVWAGWSPRCRDVVPKVNRIVRRWGKEARVMTVNFQEEREAVRSFLEGQEDLGAPVYLDAEGLFSRRHRVSTLPGLLVYRDGTVTYRGGLPEDPTEVLEAGLQP